MVTAHIRPEMRVGNKWTHCEIELEVPPDWLLDSVWTGRYPAPILTCHNGKLIVGLKYLNDRGRETREHLDATPTP